MSSFVARHPGGVEQILAGAGRDVTQVFKSYHKSDTFERYDYGLCMTLYSLLLILSCTCSILYHLLYHLLSLAGFELSHLHVLCVMHCCTNHARVLLGVN